MCVLQNEITGFYESLDFRILKFVRGVEVMKNYVAFYLWKFIFWINVMSLRRRMGSIGCIFFWLYFFFFGQSGVSRAPQEILKSPRVGILCQNSTKSMLCNSKIKHVLT